MALEIGSEAKGTVFKILPNVGALVRFTDGDVGLVHISEIAHEYVKAVEDYVRENEEVAVKVLGVNDQGRYELSMKALMPAPANQGSERRGGRSGGGGDLDEKLADFQKRSQQRLSAVRKREGRRQGRR
ncbi:MAG: S1 RNA-binding domain-containing protein [Armatimonadia bacterium]|nr:S1 RNA-binding domain-containing protein [Armatimonadia bacterium]